MVVLHQFFIRLADRSAAGVALAALALTTAGVWLSLGDRLERDALARDRAALAALEAKQAEVRGRIEQLEVDIPPQQERAMRAEKVIEQRTQLKSTWSWLTGQGDQQRANAEQLERMQALRADAVARATELQQELRRARWERDGYAIEREAIERRLREEEARRATAEYRVLRAWQRVRGWMLIAAGAYLLGTVLGRSGWRRWRAGAAHEAAGKPGQRVG